MRVDYEEISKMAERRGEINRTPLEEIVWYRDGKEIPINPKWIEEWKFTGLNHVDFIMFIDDFSENSIVGE